MNNCNYDILAKNLLLELSCKNCNHYSKERLYDPHEGRESCISFLRGKRCGNIKGIDSPIFIKWKKEGLNLPKEKICEYWE